MSLTRYAEDLRKRIETLTERHSQAELARKTGSTPNNISRYVRGRRAPLEFGTALVKGLGVNPAWLLTGEGATWLADVTADTSRTAGDLLDLIKAMTTVSRMKLGELAGKHHLSVLRQLNEALRDFETVQSSLNERLAPVFRELLEQYARVLTPHTLDRADDLRRALRQISRLCDDARLSAYFMHLQSAHEMLNRDIPAAIEFERRVLAWRLTDADALLNEEACNHVRNMMMLMYGEGRNREAAAVGRSILTLAEGLGIEAMWLNKLACQIAVSEIACGDMGRGLPRLTAAYAALPVEEREIFGQAMIFALFCSGSISVRDMMNLDAPGEHKAKIAVFGALWLEDVDILSRAVKDFVGGGYRVDPASSLAVHAVRLRDALRGQPAAKREDSYPADEYAELHGPFRAQVARIRGRSKAARRCLEEAAGFYAARPDMLSNDLIGYAIHCRNALALIPEDAKDEKDRLIRGETAGWVRNMLEGGYGFLSPLRRHADIRVAQARPVIWSRT